MVGANITWVDSIGAGTLAMTDIVAVSARFNGWLPDPMIAGEEAENPGGRLYVYEMGRRYRAKFEMPRISKDDSELVERFKLHAESAGFFAVNTADLASRSYPECQLVKGTKVGIRRDRDTMEFTISLYVTDQSATPTFMTCIYS